MFDIKMEDLSVEVPSNITFSLTKESGTAERINKDLDTLANTMSDYYEVFYNTASTYAIVSNDLLERWEDGEKIFPKQFEVTEGHRSVALVAAYNMLQSAHLAILYFIGLADTFRHNSLLFAMGSIIDGCIGCCECYNLAESVLQDNAEDEDEIFYDFVGGKYLANNKIMKETLNEILDLIKESQERCRKKILALSRLSLTHRQKCISHLKPLESFLAECDLPFKTKVVIEDRTLTMVVNDRIKMIN